MARRYTSRRLFVLRMFVNVMNLSEGLRRGEDDGLLGQLLEREQVVRGEEELALRVLAERLDDLPQEVLEDPRVELVDGEKRRGGRVDIHKQRGDGDDFLDALGFAPEGDERRASLREELRTHARLAVIEGLSAVVLNNEGEARDQRADNLVQGPIVCLRRSKVLRSRVFAASRSSLIPSGSEPQ